ncbi:MAG: OPT/YSL family transporter, partial [bacterium]
VCCSSGVAGDIIQDLKVGHILGGTPWKMEAGCMIGVVAAALVMVLPIQALHMANLDTGGLGGMELPAPQAGLMAMLAKGIVGGEMAWPLVFVGMAFSFGLILIKSPSPMLIAVGMYLPLQTTFAIFIGGIIKFFADRLLAKRSPDKEAKERFENTGILLSSGLIAGEALMGILLAFLVLAQDFLKIGPLPHISDNPWGGLVVFALIAYVLIKIPFGSLKVGTGSA